eukprot:Phypoly_transcript_26407.p1 GENE.Phypoly_transcript_26407~~Phypoly_transcript_26407.p1  ORF type:complete len:134 (+),score=20.96 Phypoly_transcript_26407:50-451(+)
MQEDSIRFRTELEDYIRREWHVPLVLVAVNGGAGTLQTVVEGARKDFKIIIVEGSGRASDAMAAYIKHQDDCKYSLREWESFLSGFSSELQAKFNSEIQELYTHKKNIHIFNPNEDAGNMDVSIFRSILSSEV